MAAIVSSIPAFRPLPGARPKLRVAHGRLAPPPRALRRVLVPPGSVTVTTGGASAMASALFRASASGVGGQAVASPVSDCFTYTRGRPADAPAAATVMFDNVTVSNAPASGACTTGIVFEHHGPALELVFSGTFNHFLVKIDDHYVSFTPTATGAGGTTLFYKLDFGGVARWRRVEVYGGVLAFDGVKIGPTDTIRPARVRGPRAIILGDSFTAFGCSATGAGIGLAVSDALGWDDVWNSGVGGSGYLATDGGAVPTFRERVSRDVIAAKPEVVLVFGGVNDSASAAAVGAEATLLFEQIRRALPGVLLLAAPTFSGGVNKAGFMTALAVKNAVKAACLAAGGLYLDLLEMPLPPGYAIPSGATVNPKAGGVSGAATGADQLLVDFVPQPGSHLDIDGTERVQVKSFNVVAPGVFGLQFDGSTRLAHAHGEPARMVGPCFWTGTGRAGATTGFGNSDLFVDTDGVHPTHDLGFRALGYALADLLLDALAPN
jgi:hypothetical protein